MVQLPGAGRRREGQALGSPSTAGEGWGAGVTGGAPGAEMSRGGISRGGLSGEGQCAWWRESEDTPVWLVLSLFGEMRDQSISCRFKGATLLSLIILTSKGRSVRMTVLLCQNGDIHEK